jgi:hypothetical protein
VKGLTGLAWCCSDGLGLVALSGTDFSLCEFVVTPQKAKEPGLKSVLPSARKAYGYTL